MAEVWAVGLATLAVGAYDANKSAKAGARGARGQEEAAAAATAEERRQFDLTRSDQLPFMEAGYDALRRQQAALEGDFSGFENSPDYQFALQQGTQQLDRGAAARGGFTGGGADADRIALGQGLASQNFGNYWNRLAGRAGQGQSAVQQLGGLGANMAGNIGNNLMGAANARASSYANSANAWNNFGQQAVGAFGSWMGSRGSQPSTRGGTMGGSSGGYGAPYVPRYGTGPA